MISDKALNTSRKSWYLELVDTSSRPRYDVSPLWADAKAFAALVYDIREHFEGIEYDLVIALDALGFILGAAIASSSGKGLVPLRKGGKLPLPAENLVSTEFQDYDKTTKRFEVVKNLIKSGDRVLLVDEWVGTGSQMRAAIGMMEQMEAVVAGIAALYILPDEPANLDIVRNVTTLNADVRCVCMDSCGGSTVSKYVPAGLTRQLLVKSKVRNVITLKIPIPLYVRDVVDTGIIIKYDQR